MEHVETGYVLNLVLEVLANDSWQLATIDKVVGLRLGAWRRRQRQGTAISPPSSNSLALRTQQALLTIHLIVQVSLTITDNKIVVIGIRPYSCQNVLISCCV